MVSADQCWLNGELQLWSENDVRLVLGSCFLRPDNAPGSAKKR